jgi:hypothetical protein
MYRTTFFFTSALVGGEWSVSGPGRFTPGERALGTHWIGGWVIRWAGLDDVEKWKLLPPPGLELRPLGRLARSQSLYPLSYPGSCSIMLASISSSKRPFSKRFSSVTAFSLLSLFCKRIQRFMRSSYCLCICQSACLSLPNFSGLWDHLAVCPLIFVWRLMSSCSLCVCVPPS